MTVRSHISSVQPSSTVNQGCMEITMRQIGDVVSDCEDQDCLSNKKIARYCQKVHTKGGFVISGVKHENVRRRASVSPSLRLMNVMNVAGE